MKQALTILVAFVVAAAGAAGASRDGGGPATTLVGGKGVLAPDGKVRYVALTTGRQTIVSVVRARGGQVLRWRIVRGYVGVPVVGLDGTTEGVSRNGRTLVLAGTPEVSAGGQIRTRFAVLDTRTLRIRQLELPGSWSYDALSPDASTLFLVEYLGTGANAAYRIRAYDVDAHRLLPRVIVDRRAKEAVMFGRAVTRTTSADGRWAYTLYARARQEPFVHALDTARRAAYCIDLPLELRLAKQTALRLRLGSRSELEVRNERVALAVVDLENLEAEKA